jgi:Ca2+-binding RTX toxin-like protein
MSVISDIKQILGYAPSWVDMNGLTPYESLDWVEKKGSEYLGLTSNNNLSWTSGKSKATLVSKASAGQFVSGEFKLSGEDKTSFAISEKNSSTSGSSVMSYSTGGSTPTKDDDVTYSESGAWSLNGGSLKLSYKDGLGASLNYSDNYKDKLTNGNGSFSFTATLACTDEDKNKLSVGVTTSGTVSDYARTTSIATLMAGSYENEAYSVTWAKTALVDSPDVSDIKLLVNDSTEFPLAKLLDAVDSYIFDSANTVKMKSIVGQDGSNSIMFLGAGNDMATGGAGDDWIAGGTGNDQINGAIGDDNLWGDAGADKLTGGKGNDTFFVNKKDFDFTSAKTVLADTITDFKYSANGEQDSIYLGDFGSSAVFQTLALAKKAGTTANVIYESKTGNFWYNEDGDSALAGALLFANAKGIPDTYWISAGVM